MSRFLVVFDRSLGRVLEVRQLDSLRSSSIARLDAEDVYRENAEVEVVVLTAFSEGDLRRTHARYFDDFEHLALRVMTGEHS